MSPAGAFVVADEHPALPGHFPGRPIVPGVMLLDAVIGLVLGRHAGQRASGLPQVKFTRPVRPGETVAVSCADPASGRVAFACRVGEAEVARGVLTLEAAG